MVRTLCGVEASLLFWVSVRLPAKLLKFEGVRSYTQIFDYMGFSAPVRFVQGSAVDFEGKVRLGGL